MYELGVRALLVCSEGKILMVKNVRNVHVGKWVLPGGTVNREEYAKESIIREIKEELNLNFEPRFYTYKEDLKTSKDKFYLTLFFTGKYSGEIKVLKDELSDYAFFSLKEINENNNVGRGHKEVIRDILKK